MAFISKPKLLISRRKLLKASALAMPAILLPKESTAWSHHGTSLAPTFADEFNSLSLWNGSSGTWATCPWYSSSNGNNATGELGWMLNSNYAPTSSIQSWAVSNGILSMSAIQAPAPIQPYIDSFAYISPYLDTYNSFSQTYGYFEFRAITPKGQGFHYGVWLLDFPPQTPYTEVDVAEGVNNATTQLVTTVWSGANQTGATSTSSTATTVDESLAFHIYSVLWTSTTITWYFDRVQVFQTATPAYLTLPMYLILDLAVGGSWPGPPDGTTPWPGIMQVDYVRAYSVYAGRKILGI